MQHRGYYSSLPPSLCTSLIVSSFYGSANHSFHRYHAHVYTNGTICDLTNQPRETEVWPRLLKLLDNLSALVIWRHFHVLSSCSLFKLLKSTSRLEVILKPMILVETGEVCLFRIRPSIDQFHQGSTDLQVHACISCTHVVQAPVSPNFLDECCNRAASMKSCKELYALLSSSCRYDYNLIAFIQGFPRGASTVGGN